MAGLDSILTIRKEDYRPCIVEERDALFHRWAEIEQLVLKCDYRIHSAKLGPLLDVYNSTGIVPHELRTEKTKTVVGVVEFEDGTVKEIRPNCIRFLDTGSLMTNDICFTKKWKEKWLGGSPDE